MGTADLLRRLKDGNCSDIVPEVQAALAGRGKSTLAYKIASPVCLAFLKKAGASCTPSKECVLHTFQTCCRAILEDHEGDSPIDVNSNFIRCVFNILHCCQKEGDPELGVHVLECSLPIFERMKSSMSDEHTKIVKRIFDTLIAVLKTSKNLFQNEAMSGPKEGFTLSNLWSLTLCISRVTDFELKAYLDILSVMFKSFKTDQINEQYLITFFLDKLKDIALLCKRMPKKDVDGPSKITGEYAKLVATLYPFISTCFKCESISDIICCIDLVSSCLSCLYPPTSEYLHCWKLAEKIMKLLIFSTKKLPKVEHFLLHLEECVDDLEKCTQFEKAKEVLKCIVDWLCSVLSLLRVYWFSHRQDVSTVFSPSVIIAFKKLADGLSKVAERSEWSVCTAPTGERCPSKTNFWLTSVPMTLLVSLYSSDLPRSEELRKVLFDAIDRLESLARQAKQVQCSKSSDIFRSICHLCQILANTYCESKEFVIAKCLLERAIRSLLSLSDDELAAASSRLTSLVSLLASHCKTLGKNDESKVAIVLPLLLKCPEKLNLYCCQLWVIFQNEEGGGSSVVDFIRKETALIEAIYPSFQLENIDSSYLLLWELNCYASFRVTRSDQILQAWLTLRDFNPAPLDLLHGAILFLKATVRSGSAKDLRSILNSMSQEFSEEMLMRLGKGKDPCALCLLAARNYYHFITLYALRTWSYQKTAKQKQLNICLESLKIVTPEDVLNPNDLCNVQLEYTDLLLKNEAELLNFLDSAIILWEKSMSCGLGLKEYSNHEVVAACSEDIVQAALMYQLFGVNKGAVRAWNLCRSYGSRMGRDDIQLQAYSGLMNLVECQPRWISCADELAETLGKDPKHKHVLDMYYNSKAFHALHTKNFTEGMTMLQKGETSSKSLWVQIQRKFLLARYSILPNSAVDLSDLNPLLTECEAYVGIQLGVGAVAQCTEGELSKTFKIPSLYSHVADQLLSLSLWLGRHYLWTKEPRHARSFLKTELKVAQNLGLATRVLEFLVVLAQVDMCVEKVDDAVDKVTDIEIILGLDSKSQELMSGDEDLGSTPEKAVITHCKNSRLEIPPHNLNSGASPGLQNTPLAISMPDFTKHPTACICFICTNITVLIVYVLMIHIKAHVQTLRLNVHAANSGYRVAANLTDFVSKKIKMMWMMPLQQHHDLMCAKVALRIGFADMLALYKKDTEALQKNASAIELLDKLSMPEKHLRVEAIQQRMGLMQMRRDDGKDVEVTVVRKVLFTPEKECGANALCKTPSNVSELKTPKVWRRKPLKPITPRNRINSTFHDELVTGSINRDLIFESDDDNTDPEQKENSVKFQCKNTPFAKAFQNFSSKSKKSGKDSAVKVQTVTSTSLVRNIFEDPVLDHATDAPESSTGVKAQTGTSSLVRNIFNPVPDHATKSSTGVKKKTKAKRDCERPLVERVTRSRTRFQNS